MNVKGVTHGPGPILPAKGRKQTQEKMPFKNAWKLSVVHPKEADRIITHGASEASGVRNFWYLSAKILYTVEPKTATPPCVHFEVAASPTEKNITSPCIHF